MRITGGSNFLVYILIALSCGACTAHADIVYRKPMFVELSGPIRPGDSATLLKILSAHRVSNLWLNSLGGDVQESLRIGRILRVRKVMATTGGWENGRKRICASACVFVLIGAPYRNVAYPRTIVIHRPYPNSNADMSLSEREAKFRERTRLLTVFFDEMNMSQELLHVINAIPPEEGHLLTDSEISKWGLDKNDPVQEESDDADNARQIGISLSEFVRRKAFAEQTCDHLLVDSPNIDDYDHCENAILYDIPVAEYVMRSTNADSKCSRFHGKLYTDCRTEILTGVR